MKKIYFLLSLIILTCNFESFADRAMYVNDFSNILGDSYAEDLLLSYAQNNEIETLLLYELHIVNANYNLTNTETNYILADFIAKAKTNYGIVNIGATAENANFFTNVIDTYNNSRNNANEKFDIYNLEFEFWNASATDDGEYYCTTYLTPNDLPCTNEGAFHFFISTLQTMRNLATNNTHPITTEAYVGWPTAEQAATIGENLDRLRLHAYVSDPNTAFSYTKNRLKDYANSNIGSEVSIIFSSEPEFMQDWLINNSMSAAENIFTTDWMKESADWENNINLEGFTYFVYTYNTDIVLSTDREMAYEKLIAYPNPVKNTLTIEDINKIKSIKIYNCTGQLIIKTTDKNIDFSTLPKGIYLLQCHTDKGIQTKTIVKE